MRQRLHENVGAVIAIRSSIMAVNTYLDL